MAGILQGVGLGCTFGSGVRALHALEDVDVSLEAGRTLGVVGESGSGKSTLGEILGGLRVPTRGAVFYRGREVRALDRAGRTAYRRDVQFVYQDASASIDPRYTVLRAVCEPLDAFPRELPARERQARALDMLERVGLSCDVAPCRARELSGGQQQRVAIARALVGRPAVVVCDECTSALDVSVQAQILNLLRDLQEDLGCSYVFIGHDMGVVGYLAHDVCVLHRGRVVEQGPAQAVLLEPSDPYTQSLVRASREEV